MPLDDHTLLLQLERAVESLTDASIDAIEVVQQRIDTELETSPWWDRIADLEVKVDRLEASVQNLEVSVQKLDAKVSKAMRLVLELINAQT